MKVFNVEAANINNGQELANYAYSILKNLEFSSEEEFYAQLDEGALLTEAANACGWSSVPAVGGFVFEFDN